MYLRESDPLMPGCGSEVEFEYSASLAASGKILAQTNSKIVISYIPVHFQSHFVISIKVTVHASTDSFSSFILIFIFLFFLK